MSTSYYGHTVIGVAFQMPDHLEIEKVIPSCPHPERIGNVYCPTCGTKVADRKTVDLTDTEEIREDFRGKLPRNYLIVGDSYERDATFYIGYGASLSSYRDNKESLDLPDPDKVKRVIKKFMQEYGLSDVYDESTFGLHCIMTWG